MPPRRINREFHGMSQTSEYRSWISMNKRAKEVPRYIQLEIFEEWKTSFLSFYNHIGPKENPDHSVDRIDNSRGYFPGNVRWASQEKQLRNRPGFNVQVFYKGKYMLLVECAELVGIDQKLLRTRLKQGMTLEDAVELWNYKEKKPLTPKIKSNEKTNTKD